jgi:hypothetical protein
MLAAQGLQRSLCDARPLQPYGQLVHPMGKPYGHLQATQGSGRVYPNVGGGGRRTRVTNRSSQDAVSQIDGSEDARTHGPLRWQKVLRMRLVRSADLSLYLSSVQHTQRVAPPAHLPIG